MKDYLFYVGPSYWCALELTNASPIIVKQQEMSELVVSMKEPFVRKRRSNVPPNIEVFEGCVNMLYSGDSESKALGMDMISEGEALFESKTE